MKSKIGKPCTLRSGRKNIFLAVSFNGKLSACPASTGLTHVFEKKKEDAINGSSTNFGRLVCMMEEVVTKLTGPQHSSAKWLVDYVPSQMTSQVCHVCAMSIFVNFYFAMKDSRLGQEREVLEV